MYERTAGGGYGGSGGLALAGGGFGGGGSAPYVYPSGGQTVVPNISAYVPLLITFIPLSTASELDTLRAEIISIQQAKLSSKKKKKQKNGNPEQPNVKYPGNDSTKAPGEGFIWRGNKNEPVGSDKGAWINRSTGEQWHPDLNHPLPKGPHWDYTDIYGIVWAVFENGEVKIWED